MNQTNMNRLTQLLFVLGVMLALPGAMRAASVRVDVDQLRYTIDTDAGEAELDGPVSSSTRIVNLTIPDFIEYNGDQYPVTSIGENAFWGNKNVSGSLMIGNSVTSIGEGAFYECSGFTGSLTIGNSVTTIGRRAFCECSGFTGSLMIPNSVTTIGVIAFYNCDGFTGSLTIPNSVTTIGSSAFYGCDGFTGSLTIGNSVTTIEYGAFSDCDGFTGSLTIPNSVTRLGAHAFAWCEGFDGTLTLSENLSIIEDEVFTGCKNLTGSLILPQNIASIGKSAFSSCENLSGELIIPNSVTTIGALAFRCCENFTGSLTIGNSVTTIGNSAFDQCSKIESLYLPAGLKSIDYDAFFYCSNLNKIECEAKEPPVVGNGRATFPTRQRINLYVPAESLNLYKTAKEWKDFKSINPIGAEVTEIKLDKSSASISIGENLTLTATIEPENAVDKTIVWTSSDENIATVTEGVVTGVNVGNVTITATTSNGLAATCKVTVTPVSPTSIDLNIKDMVLFIGQSETIQAVIRPANTTYPTVTWHSENESIATVSANGKVTGIAEGVATITAKCGNVSATCVVTVNPIPASNIEITSGNVTLTIGSSTKLAAKVSPESTTHPEVEWSSSDTGIATITADGIVTAVSLGTVVITAKCGNVSTTCTVTVIPVPSEGIVISPSSVSMLLGDKTTLTASVFPENTTDKTVTWGSDNPAVASVTSDGVVTALGLGTATITASNGLSKATCRVTVNPVVATSISLNVKDETIFVASTTQLVASFSPENVTDKTITWTSSKPEIATVSDQGLVYGVAVGTTTITASIGSVSTTCQINVVHRIPDMDPAVSTSERDIFTLSGQPVNMAVYATGGEPTGWSYVWTKNGEVVSKSDELNITAINDSETIIADTYRVKVENEIDKVVIFSEIFDFVVRIYPAVETSANDNDITISTGNNGSNKTREGNKVTLSVMTPKGGNPQGWEYVWSDPRGEIGEGETIETVASMSSGNSMAIEQTAYTLKMTDYSPEGEVWAQFNLANTLDVYRRPETPSQMLRKGNGSSHTFIAMMPVPDEQLGKLGYTLVYGWTDSDGNDHTIEQTSLRYCHTDAETYNKPTNKFWVYSVWNYQDGSVVSSGRRYLDGSLDEDFDASVFDGSGVMKDGQTATRSAIYTINGHYLGTDLSKLRPGIYIYTTETEGVKNTEKIIIK